MHLEEGEETVLDVQDLSKSYGSQVALTRVSLEVQAGEIVGLLGRNGAGKTTLVSIVAGLRQADAGRVLIGGIDAARHPRRARAHLGCAPQETGVYPTLSCFENLRFFAGVAGKRGQEARSIIDELATALELDGLLDRRAQHLSGGERRRLHTAIALVGEPNLVLLDEPTVGADVQTRSHVLHVVKQLAARGTAVVYSTHYFPEVEQLGASVVILERGQVRARGSIENVVAAHAPGAVELTFAGPVPDLSSIADGHAIEVTGNEVRIETQDAAALTARLFTQLGSRAGDLRALAISPPSLETAFLKLTETRPERADGETSRVA
jgi:ABC-2 type transport system ATP-binding protein